MHSFTAQKSLSNRILHKPPVGYSVSNSFNKQTTYSRANTRFLIVGTITPVLGREVGYFYCSPSNQVYSFIDKAFDDGGSLSEIKTELQLRRGDNVLLNDLFSLLDKRKIAFLDVIKTCVSNNSTASDKGIIEYVLDFEAFKGIDFDKTIIIVNSKNAEVALKYILKENGVEKTIIDSIQLIPQQILGWWHRYKNNEELERHWVRILKTGGSAFE